MGWMERVRQRFGRIGREGWESIEEGVGIREGSIKDYQTLAKYHYRAGRPGTVRKVWVAEAKGGEDAPPQGRRLTLRQDGSLADVRRWWWGRGVVGVLVVSMPMLRCRLRDEATGGRYARIRDARERAALINAEVRCISRVVVDPRWRGLGIAVQLVKQALGNAETVYTEAVAAMGAVHPLFEKAGMTGYQRPAHEFDLRMKAALQRAGIDLETLGGPGALAARLAELPTGLRAWLEQEMRRWWGRRKAAADEGRLTQIERQGRRFNAERTPNTGRRPLDWQKWLEAARGALLGEPAYYLWRRD